MRFSLKRVKPLRVFLTAVLAVVLAFGAAVLAVVHGGDASAFAASGGGSPAGRGMPVAGGPGGPGRTAAAAPQGGWVDTFGPNGMSDGEYISVGLIVRALVVDGAGNAYAGGKFLYGGSVRANYVARWDGGSWSALGSGMNNPVYALALDQYGNLYAGGSFTTAGGESANYIAKWDGSAWSPLGTGMNASVSALAVDSAGNLYAGGDFATAGGVSASRIARWDGSTWSPLGIGANSSVTALEMGNDGYLYAGGWFTTAGGVTAKYVARWDGSNWSAVGSGFDYYVRDLAFDTDGSLYAAGGFTEAGSESVRHVAKWNGSAWSAVGGGTNYGAYALAARDGYVYAGGNFTEAGGVSANHVAVWDGSNWHPLGSGLNGYAQALALDPNNNLYAGGEFFQAGPYGSGYIGMWSPTGPAEPTPTQTATATETPTARDTSTPTPTTTWTPVSTVTDLNLAAASNGGQVFDASSNYGGGWDMSKIIDGNAGTMWLTNPGYTSNQMVTVELARGDTYTINRVRLNPAGYYQGDNLKNFEIKVSSTDTQPGSFTTVASGTTPQQDAFFEYTFSPVQARYVMLVALDNYGGDYLGLRELEVYGSGATIAPNIALASNGGQIAGYSSNYGGEWDVAKLIDGADSSGWSTEYGQVTDEWATVELANGAYYSIDRVRLSPASYAYYDTVRSFEIRVSTTNTQTESFTTVLSSILSPREYAFAYRFSPVQARFVMLYVVENYGGAYLELAELEVYGTQAGAPPTATPTATATPTSTDTATPTASATETPTATDTPTFTATATDTATATETHTPTPTETFTPTATRTFTATPTETGTATSTPTVTTTATHTATDTATGTPSASNTPTPTVTDTPANTSTLGPTSTATGTATNTPTSSATATATATATPSSSPTVVASPPACNQWNLTSEFRLWPDQENPGRDSCGNAGVWNLMGSATLTRDPQTYYTFTTFYSDTDGVTGLNGWMGDGYNERYHSYTPVVMFNNTGSTLTTFATFPANTVAVHPSRSQMVIVGWRSPIQGSVAITGYVADINPGGDDGIAWYIDKGSATLASGDIPNGGGSQSFTAGSGGESLAGVQVGTGELIYFIIHPKANHGYDSTGLDITITYLGPVVPSATPTSTASATETSTATPTVTATATPIATYTPTPTATRTSTATRTPVPTGTVTMYFQPSSAAISQGEILTVEVWMNAGPSPQGRRVSAIDAYFDYDKSYLEIVDGAGKPISAGAFISSTAMPKVNFNEADNAQGRAIYSAGVDLGAPAATGNFLYATVRFRARADTQPAGTLIQLHYSSGNPSDPRNTLITDPVGNPIPMELQPATVRVNSAWVAGSVQFMARGSAPSARWTVPLTVSLHSPGSSSPAFVFAPTTDSSGQFSAGGFPPGTYDVKVKKAHALTNYRASVDLPVGSSSFSFGLLLDGDANGDCVVNSLDYSLLASAYMRTGGQAGFDERVDFNGDGRINASDYAALAVDYFKRCDILIGPPPPSPTATASSTSSATPSSTPTGTATATWTGTSTATDTATATSTNTPTLSPSATASATTAATSTATPTASPTWIGYTTACGTINSDTTWGPSGSPYVLSCGVVVNAGVNLTILPGTVVKASTGDVKLEVYGTLTALGTASDKVAFTSLNDDGYGGDTNKNGFSSGTRGDWSGIIVRSGGTANFDYAIVRYGGYSYHMIGSTWYYGSYGNIWAEENSVTAVRHSTISQGWNAGIWVNGSGASLTVSDSTIDNNSEPNSAAYKYGIYHQGSNSSVAITNTTFFTNTGWAVYLNTAPATLTGIGGSGNGTNGIGLKGTISGDVSWVPNENMPYVVDGNLQVPAGSSLTLQPGVVMKFTSGDYKLDVSGVLTAVGTSNGKVVFTSLKDDEYGGNTDSSAGPAKGEWGGIIVRSGATANLDYSVVRYGGYSQWMIGSTWYYGSYGNIWAEGNSVTTVRHSTISQGWNAGIWVNGNGASLTVSDSSIENNGDTNSAAYKYGVYQQGSGGSVAITNTTFFTNTGWAVYLNTPPAALTGLSGSGNGTDGIGLKGSINGNVSWEPQTGLAYVVDGNLQVPAGSSLTLQPGVVMKFTSGDRKLDVSGVLTAVGTSNGKVVFTSLKDDEYGGNTDSSAGPAKGEWSGIIVRSGATANLDYSVVKYGGYSQWMIGSTWYYGSYGNIWAEGNSVTTVRRSTISQGWNAGIWVNGSGSSLTVSDSTIDNNGDANSAAYKYGIYNGSGSVSVVNGNNIYQNNGYGLYNADTSITLDAQNNWWGSDTGPYHAANAGGIGNQVSDRVDYTPWASQQY